MTDAEIKSVIINDHVIDFDELVHVTPPISKLITNWGGAKPSIGLLYTSNPGKMGWLVFHDQETAIVKYEEIIVQWNLRKMK